MDGVKILGTYAQWFISCTMAYFMFHVNMYNVRLYPLYQLAFQWIIPDQQQLATVHVAHLQDGTGDVTQVSYPDVLTLYVHVYIGLYMFSPYKNLQHWPGMA